MVILITAGVCLALSAGLLAAGFRESATTRSQLRILNASRLHAQSEIQRKRMELLEVRHRAKLMEDTVSGGATAVEKVHKVIANTTFGLIDRFAKDEEFKNTARKVKKTHHEKSEQVYQVVRTTNRAVHILADSLFIGKAEKRIISKTKKAP
ncbi:hypothetical protein [Marinobacter litoralis]|uniref:hypothetical protein n=1 Tax=Marinobacter litoralis TaxID=187981 RepID=UPI0018EDC5E5|nr:hypothetical protein [Marinobacter litoralis]MBJ6137845.1 hypothetical protein [Marinobacter litoralis]